LSPTGKEQIMPVPSFRCSDCGHINEEFLIK
jgi:predicted nucleic acid-binding Zn ribbon protein